MHYVNNTEIKIVATKRSGHHAIIDWICRMIQANLLTVCFINDNKIGMDPYKKNIQRQYRKFLIPKEEYKDFIIHNYEDYKFSAIENYNNIVGNSKTVVNVIIIRDLWNLMASRIRRTILEGKTFNLNKAVEIWKDHAINAIGNKNNSYVIVFNKWWKDKKYRKKITKNILNISYKNIELKNVGNSSFKKKFRKGGEGNLEERWKLIGNHRCYWNLFTEKLVNLNNKACVKIAGAEIKWKKLKK